MNDSHVWLRKRNLSFLFVFLEVFTYVSAFQLECNLLPYGQLLCFSSQMLQINIYSFVKEYR